MKKSLYLGALVLLIGCGEGSESGEPTEGPVSAVVSGIGCSSIGAIALRDNGKQICKSVGEPFEIQLSEPDSTKVWMISKAGAGVSLADESKNGFIRTFGFKARTRGLWPISLVLRTLPNNKPISTFEVHIYAN